MNNNGINGPNGGDANGGNASDGAGDNAGGRILTPQVPRIVPRFMGGKHIRGMGEGYQRRFTPKTFHIPGEEPQPPPPQPSKDKLNQDDDDSDENAVMTDIVPLVVPPEDMVEVPLAPIWERPTR